MLPQAVMSVSKHTQCIRKIWGGTQDTMGGNIFPNKTNCRSASVDSPERARNLHRLGNVNFDNVGLT